MQRTVLKVVVGLVAVGVLLVGVIAVALPRLVNSDEFRLALHETVAETLGTPVEWESLDVRLLPLRLAINAPVLVAAAGNPEEARLTAESLDLRLALLPIFARRVQIDSLVLHGVELIVTRTAEGFLLPIAASEEETPAEANSAESADDSMAVEETAEEGAFGLALNRIVISKSRIIVRDRTVPEPIEWRLEDLEFEAKSRSDDERLEIELAAKVRSGTSDAGRIQTAGTVSLAGLYDLDVEIEELLLAELQPYLPGPTVTGMLSGRVSLEGATSTLSKIDLDLSVDQLALRTAERDFVGGLTLQASQALGDPVAFSAVLDLETGGQAEITGKLMLENDGSIRFSTDLATSNGGRLGIEGTSNPEGVLDVRAEFESFDLVIAGPFLPGPKIELAGLATGNAQLIGAAGSPESVNPSSP